VSFPPRIVLVSTLAATVLAGGGMPGAEGAGQRPDLNATIAQLGAFEYQARMDAARRLRRVPAPEAVPALVEAVRGHQDQFVRYRALVLVTGFNDRGTADLMRSLLGDRNDRVREVAYRWFARHPDPSMTQSLLGALRTEQAEFVRPALVSALAALGSDAQVQRALTSEAGRGLDFFRIAVIEALGERRAAYAADTILEVARLDGPLQDDAVLALARIGDRRATTIASPGSTARADTAAALYAAHCLLGQDCPGQVKALLDIAAAPRVAPQVVRAAMTALGAIAARPDAEATAAIVTFAQTASPGLRAEAAVALSVVALRVPAHMLSWLDAADDAVRAFAVEMLQTGFERLEEDFAEEQFFAAARAAYWAAGEGSPERTRVASLIDELDF
jgi:HEAT repeat protein